MTTATTATVMTAKELQEVLENRCRSFISAGTLSRVDVSCDLKLVSA